MIAEHAPLSLDRVGGANRSAPWPRHPHSAAVARRWDHAKDHAVWPAAVDRGAMASAEPVAPIFANNLDQSFPIIIWTPLHHSLSSYRRILTGYTGYAHCPEKQVEPRLTVCKEGRRARVLAPVEYGLISLDITP